MADLEDVTAKLVSIISGTLYPNGVNNPPVSGFPSRVMPGWPLPSDLDAALKTALTIVSVYPRPEERNTTRYHTRSVGASHATGDHPFSDSQWRGGDGGRCRLSSAERHADGQRRAVYLRREVDRHAADSCGGPRSFDSRRHIGPRHALDWRLELDRRRFLRLHRRRCYRLGPAARLSRCPRLRTSPQRALAGAAQSDLENRRQERLFQIGIWANSPKARTAVAKAIDPVLGNMPFIALPDLSMGRLRYKNSFVTDANQKQLLYRRDLFYSVEYATTQVLSTPQLMTLGIHPSVGVAPPYQAIATENI